MDSTSLLILKRGVKEGIIPDRVISYLSEDGNEEQTQTMVRIVSELLMHRNNEKIRLRGGTEDYDKALVVWESLTDDERDAIVYIGLNEAKGDLLQGSKEDTAFIRLCFHTLIDYYHSPFYPKYKERQ